MKIIQNVISSSLMLICEQIEELKRKESEYAISLAQKGKIEELSDVVDIFGSGIYSFVYPELVALKLIFLLSARCCYIEVNRRCCGITKTT